MNPDELVPWHDVWWHERALATSGLMPAEEARRLKLQGKAPRWLDELRSAASHVIPGHCWCTASFAVAYEVVAKRAGAIDAIRNLIAHGPSDLEHLFPNAQAELRDSIEAYLKAIGALS